MDNPLLINQATLAIVFFHFPLLWLGQEIMRSVAGWTPMWAKLAMWPFALAGPIVIWAAFIALRLTLATGAPIRTNYLRAGKDRRPASAV